MNSEATKRCISIAVLKFLAPISFFRGSITGVILCNFQRKLLGAKENDSKFDAITKFSHPSAHMYVTGKHTKTVIVMNMTGTKYAVLCLSVSTQNGYLQDSYSQLNQNQVNCTSYRLIYSHYLVSFSYHSFRL